jgi:predicted esterase
LGQTKIGSPPEYGLKLNDSKFHKKVVKLMPKKINQLDTAQRKKPGKNNLLNKILLGFLSVLIIVIAGFVIWGNTPTRPDKQAVQALESDQEITVTERRTWLQFIPAKRTPKTGFIFYPGGRVDYRAYAPLMREIAAGGNAVYLVEMPLSLAVFGAERADAVIAANPGISTWYIGGHSLGGAMAAAYVYNNPVAVQGLVLWAAYPAENNDLSQSGFPVLSIIANRDGLATLDKLKATAPLLPANTMWVEIDGGNHAQFGSYGSQRGDQEATISAEEQHRQIVDATLMFMSGMR